MTDKYVYFTQDLTVTEEYNLIVGKKDNNDKKEINRSFGNSLIKKSTLFTPIDLSINEYQNERLFFVLISMISCPPFYNLLRSMEIKKKKVMSLGSSILEFINTGHLSEIFLGIRYDKIFHSICAKLHSELTECYFFEENEWNESTKIEKLRIYKEYSPIVELFHLKTKQLVDNLFLVEYFESVTVNKINKKTNEDFVNETNESSTFESSVFANSIDTTDSINFTDSVPSINSVQSINKNNTINESNDRDDFKGKGDFKGKDDLKSNLLKSDLKNNPLKSEIKNNPLEDDLKNILSKEIKNYNLIERSLTELVDGKIIEKLPYILSFDIKTGENITIPSHIMIRDTRFNLNSLITKNEVIFKINDKWFKGFNYKVSEVDTIPKVCEAIMTFYTIDEKKFLK
ncbi:hypothetical protein DMUE_1256 [Dictyocoela muelleri]|nr:hypothetical protein DMUE_1256 [Dictyocoela muelleri]